MSDPRPPESPPRLHNESRVGPHQPSGLHPDIPPAATNGTRTFESMTIPERLQTALHRIHTLEVHNAKLFQDNSKLVHAVNMLNDRLAYLGAPQNTLVHRLFDMQERLHASDESRALVGRKYQELLQCTSAGSAHQHLLAELQAAHDAYASLDREFHLLRDKCARLKTLADTGRAAQQQSQGPTRGLIPVGRTEFGVHGQTLNNSVSSTSATPPASFQQLPNQNGNHRRRSSGGVMAQSPLRSGPASVPTAWTAPLPTPPPSASLPAGQISPTGNPVHASVPAASLPLPPPQIIHGPRTLSSPLPSATQLHHPADPGTSEQPKPAVHPRQRHEETTDAVNREPIQFGQQNSTPVSSGSSPRPLKRPDSEPQTSASPRGVHKKPRTEGESAHSPATSADTCPVNKIPSPSAPADLHHDLRSSDSGPDVRSYQDCVNLIFEKDADVEHGVFCGLCFDRYQAKMIPEPPDVLVQPVFDFLVMHCMTMHPTAWDDLRRKA